MIGVKTIFDTTHKRAIGLNLIMHKQNIMPETTAVSVTIKHNKELSHIFKKMSDCYKYLGNKERFRAIAYETASKTLNNLEVPVDIYHDDIKKLDELKGVGESIAAKIIEYLDEGGINTFEELKKKVPYQLLELLEIEGIGPATVKKISKHLHVASIDELKKKIKYEKIDSIKGVNKTQMKKILTLLRINIQIEKRISLEKALETGNNLLHKINKINWVIKSELAGSIRRKKETIGDIDIVIVADKKNNKHIMNEFTGLPEIKEIISSGIRKASVILKDGNIKTDIQLVGGDEYGSSILYFTGSKEHNIVLRSMARKKGWRLNEYGLFDSKTKTKLAGETEKGIYEKLGLIYIPPEKRTGKIEFN